MRYFIFTLLTVVLFQTKTFAQVPFESSFGIKYDVNVPLSNRNYLDNTSFVGFDLEGKWMLNDNVAAGISIAWTSYYQLDKRTTYSRPGIDVTTDLYKNVYIVPILLNGTYFFSVGDRVIPYGTMSLGTSYVNHKLLFNVYEANSYTWGLTARPEIGALFMVGPNTALSLSARYSYMTNKENDLGYKDFQSLGFQIGLVLTQ